jgi:hypothetical protein
VPHRRELRWNKFVPLDEADPDETVLVQSSSADPFVSSTANVAPTPLQQMRDRFTALMVPFGLAAAFFGPPTETVRRRVRTTSATDAPFVLFAEVFDDAWVLHAELLAADDVRELERLWALPYPGPTDADFRLHE